MTWLPQWAVDDALSLIEAVRTYDKPAIAKICELTDLRGVVVALAAMVDDGRTPTELLAWNDTNIPNPAGPAPHGTHAAFNRHKKAGELPCSVCVHGERVYQRVRSRRRRALVDVAV